MSAMPASNAEGPLALVCGGGSLPLAVADAAAARGRPVVLFLLHGTTDPESGARYPHHWLHLGQLGKFARLAHAAGCRDVAFIGSLVRPSLWQLRFDLTALMLLPRIAAAFRGGDDYLLSNVSRLVERQGLRLVAAHEVAPEILVPQGVLGRTQPSERHQADIALGLDYLRAAGPFDIGQAVVVADKRVLAVEAAEGTDQMLNHLAQLRESGRIKTPRGAGVLVKAPKPNQDRRFDLPSIGPHTVEGAVRAGLAGIAVASGETVIAEAEALVAAADRADIFVVGVAAGAPQ
jgi:UDP-2,3-diacylglucosamine hydrolase